MLFFDIEEWIIFDFGAWKLKKGAPEEVKKKFTELTKTYEDNLKKGVFID